MKKAVRNNVKPFCSVHNSHWFFHAHAFRSLFKIFTCEPRHNRSANIRKNVKTKFICVYTSPVDGFVSRHKFHGDFSFFAVVSDFIFYSPPVTLPTTNVFMLFAILWEKSFKRQACTMSFEPLCIFCSFFCCRRNGLIEQGNTPNHLESM